MKKYLKAFIAIMYCATLFFSCSNGSEQPPEVEAGTIGEVPEFMKNASELMKTLDPNNEKIILIYSRPDTNYGDWGLWLWETGGECADSFYTDTKGKFLKDSATGFGVMVISDITTLSSGVKTAIADGNELNFIIRNDGWSKDPGTDQIMDISSGKHFMVISKDTTVYTIKETASPTITGAQTTDTNLIKVTLNVNYGLNPDGGDSNFILKDSEGTTYEIVDSYNADYPNLHYKNNATNVILKVKEDLDLTKTYYISHPLFSPENGTKVGLTVAIKAGLINKTVPISELGVKINGTTANFATWAPVASSVSLLLYNDWACVVANPNTPDVKPMTFDINTGKWSINDVDIQNYKYYKYRIVNGTDSNDIADIYSYVAGPDSIASQICSIDDESTKPEGWESEYVNPAKGVYENAIIYEMHIRDWSRALGTDSEGNFIDFSNDKIIDHLKEIGITHVQILPMFDHAEVCGAKYNWGYNPYHYNVPESRYATKASEYEHSSVPTHFDGSEVVKEMRTMIMKLHNAGIAVIMDVVYNHTSGTGKGSLYDMTVPYYYYRLNPDGSYSNGSGCGNETDSEAPMYRSYMIESLKHWMNDYHINGFRFDLMGIHSKETMKEIYDSLKEIDPSVMVYGEPWTGGTALVSNGTTQSVKGSGEYGVAAFDDDFRDAIKGAEFGGFKKGQVQGSYNDSDLINGLLGKAGKNKRNQTGNLGLALHYVECHDNYTLFDKLAISYLDKTKYSGDLFKAIKDEGLLVVKAQNKLSAAYIFLSQGTVFMNGGQEFLRTKRGNENSYNSTDVINGIDLSFKETYADVYNTYKGLIALRKANPSAFGSNESATAEIYNKTAGVTKYTTGDFRVYFNATEKSVEIESTGYTKAIDVTSGTPTESTTLPASVPAKSFVILKK